MSFRSTHRIRQAPTSPRSSRSLITRATSCSRVSRARSSGAALDGAPTSPSSLWPFKRAAISLLLDLLGSEVACDLLVLLERLVNVGLAVGSRLVRRLSEVLLPLVALPGLPPLPDVTFWRLTDARLVEEGRVREACRVALDVGLLKASLPLGVVERDPSPARVVGEEASAAVLLLLLLPFLALPDDLRGGDVGGLDGSVITVSLSLLLYCAACVCWG